MLSSAPKRMELPRRQSASVELKAGEARRFPTTRWSLVLLAGGAEGRQAASELCRAYWHPVQAFFRSQGAREDEASDITQGFFAELHRRCDFGNLDPSRGKFRSWLCACAKNHLLRVRAHERASKRGGTFEDTSPNDASPSAEVGESKTRGKYKALRPNEEDAYSLSDPELQELRDPQRLFDRRWAQTVISRALDRLREHYAGCDKSELFQSLEGRQSGEGPDLSDAALAALLGTTEAAVRQARHKLKAPVKERFARFVRAEIAETVAAREHIDEEIRDLLRALT